MEIRDRQLLNRTVTADEDVVVRVDLANYHPVRGRITLNLTANRSLVAQRTVAVGIDGERTVYLRAASRVPGRYEMRVNGAAVGTVTVTGSTESPSVTATPAAGTPSATVVPTATPEPSEGEPTGEEPGTRSPDRTGTTTPADDSEAPTGIDTIVAVGMSLMLIYGVGVAVYVLRENPPSRLD